MLLDHDLRHLGVLAVGDKVERRCDERILRGPNLGFRLMCALDDLHGENLLIVVQALEQRCAIVILASGIDSQCDHLGNRRGLTSQRMAEPARCIGNRGRTELGLDHDGSAIPLTNDDVRAAGTSYQGPPAFGVGRPAVPDLLEPIGDGSIGGGLVEPSDLVCLRVGSHRSIQTFQMLSEVILIRRRWCR